MRHALQQIKIADIPDTEISFDTPSLAGYANGNCTTSACRVFNPSGGGMVYMIPAVHDWLDPAQSASPLYGQWYFPARVCVVGVGSGVAGCRSDGVDNESLLIVLPWVKKDICIAINDKLGIPCPGNVPPTQAANAWPATNPKFTGTYADGAELDLGGLRTGCFEGSAGNTPPDKTYTFFQVLLAR